MIEDVAGRIETRRKSYFAAVFTILPFWAVDLALPGSSPWACLTIRAAWASIFLVAALIAGRVPERTLDRMAYGGAVVTTASMCGLVALTGGAFSAYVFALPLLPVLTAVMEPWGEGPAWVSGLCSAAGGAWIGISSGLPAGAVAAWFGGNLVATAWATFGFRESRRLRQVALDSGRLAAIGRLAAGVAHEINNPLSFAMANVQFLREELPSGPDADEQREAADEALVGLQRIRGIVLDLRGFAREESGGQVVPAPPGDAIEEALRIASIQLKSRVRVASELADSLPAVPFPRGRLVQVLVNLLVNAGDALDGRTDGEVRLSGAVRRDRLVLAVEDNGPGVPRAHRKLLFQPFHTTKPLGKGMGLGLALSRDYAERVGGTLRYEDRPGGGARFVLELPLADGAAIA
jgi:signal transduction histidine kinase